MRKGRGKEWGKTRKDERMEERCWLRKEGKKVKEKKGGREKGKKRLEEER